MYICLLVQKPSDFFDDRLFSIQSEFFESSDWLDKRSSKRSSKRLLILWTYKQAIREQGK